MTFSLVLYLCSFLVDLNETPINSENLTSSKILLIYTQEDLTHEP